MVRAILPATEPNILQNIWIVSSAIGLESLLTAAAVISEGDLKIASTPLI